MLRSHLSDRDRLFEFRKPTYVHPTNRNIKVRSFVIPPSQNVLIQEKLAHEVAAGVKYSSGKTTRIERSPDQLIVIH